MIFALLLYNSLNVSYSKLKVQYVFLQLIPAGSFLYVFTLKNKCHVFHSDYIIDSSNSNISAIEIQHPDPYCIAAYAYHVETFNVHPYL